MQFTSNYDCRVVIYGHFIGLTSRSCKATHQDLILKSLSPTMTFRVVVCSSIECSGVEYVNNGSFPPKYSGTWRSKFDWKEKKVVSVFHTALTILISLASGVPIYTNLKPKL